MIFTAVGGTEDEDLRLRRAVENLRAAHLADKTADKRAGVLPRALTATADLARECAVVERTAHQSADKAAGLPHPEDVRAFHLDVLDDGTVCRTEQTGGATVMFDCEI